MLFSTTYIDFCLKRIEEIPGLVSRFERSHPVVVACFDWGDRGELSDCCFDFYAVTGTDSEEGKITGKSLVYCQAPNSRWISRSGNDIDFWVVEFCEIHSLYHLSFVHPKDFINNIPGFPGNKDWLPCLGFNCPLGMKKADVKTKKKAGMFEKLNKTKEGVREVKI